MRPLLLDFLARTPPADDLHAEERAEFFLGLLRLPGAAAGWVSTAVPLAPLKRLARR
ncbi:hypothetical protein [Verrucomicrobium spinosum]|uniref:hypothetical protein n=1 Tax=Verrucomicrobium spinosum TaxID=2736 RepID=UPI000ACF4B67|nr:hypothetical protein [Verrucomicrobium spinosum]